MTIATPLFLAALLLQAPFGQEPVPAPLPAPAPAPAETPENALWKKALELKGANKGREAHELFARFRREYPADARAADAPNEMGVCWMIVGRDKQQWHRNRPESVDAFRKALADFALVTEADPKQPAAARSWYCQGLAWIQLDDLARAEQAFTRAIDGFPADTLYRAKSIERRAATWRHRLETAKAQPDLERYLREVDKNSADFKAVYELVERFTRYAKAFDRPAPELRPESWPVGTGTTLAALRGEPVLLYFFAQWCHNCEKEASFVHEMHERWGPLGLKFLGVTDFSTAPQGPAAGNDPNNALETEQTVAGLRAYCARHQLTMPVLIDRGATAGLYQARKYPEIVLIDREGRLRWHDHPANLLDSTLERLLFGPPESEGQAAPTPPAGGPAPPAPAPGGKR